MKYIVSIILVICAFTLGTAQRPNVIKKVILFDSLSLDDLKEKGIVSDILIRDNQIIFLEYVANNEKRQYFKLSDSTYSYRSYYEGDSYESGGFLLNNIDDGNPHVYITVCYPEQVITTKKHHLLKHGSWYKQNPSGETFRGSYHKGKKVGVWRKRDFRNLRIEKEYEDGVLIKQTHPEPYEVNNFIKSYKGKTLSTIINNDITKIDTIRIEFDTNSKIINEDYTKYLIEFNSTKDIIVKSNIEVQPEWYALKLNWKYWPEVFTVNKDGVEMYFKVLSVGKNGLELIRKESKKR